MDIVQISAIFLERFPTDAEFECFCAQMKLASREALDIIAVSIGKRFLDGTLAYEDGDEIMNTVWSFALRRDEIPKTMYAIYEAFDAGEYFRESDSEDVDPVEKYTRPALSKLLSSNAA